MTLETPDTIASTWMERVWNQLDTDAIDELLTDDHVSYGIGDAIVGKAGWREFHAAFSGALSNIKLGIDDQVVSGNRVAAAWSGTATHAATGTPVTMSGMVFLRVEDGRVAEGRNSADFIPMLTQIGLVDENAMARALGAV